VSNWVDQGDVWSVSAYNEGWRLR